MTGETLKACPICGQTETVSVERAFGKPAKWVVGCRFCPLEHAVVFNSEADAVLAWNLRALGPALDTVLEAVEAMDDAELAAVSKAYRQSGVAMDMPVGRLQTQILAMLRALRAEQSAGAGGERGGGL